jgi:hypothetical protein
MKAIHVFEAYTNSDTIEGRGSDVHIGYFTHPDDAHAAARGQGVMGGDAYVRPVAIKIYTTLQEFTGVKNEELRQRALEKLTPEEREALGL